MIAKNRLPFVFDPKEEPLRIGLLPRMDTDATNLRWFEFPAQVMFHTAAAFEEGDVVKMYACAFNEVRWLAGFSPAVARSARCWMSGLRRTRLACWSLHPARYTWAAAPAHCIWSAEMLMMFTATQFSLDLDDGHESETAPMLYEYAMNTKTGETGVRLMDKTLYGDFPVIPARFAGAAVDVTACHVEPARPPICTCAVLAIC